jgi:hypothetical protein
MATVIYPAKKALFEALVACDCWGDHDPAVLWGEPVDAAVFPRGLEAVYMGDPLNLADDFTTIGAHRLDERFSLPVVVDVIRPGDDEKGAECRAWELRDAVIDVVRSDLTLGSTISHITGFRVQAFTDADPKGWRKRIRIDVACVGHELLST